jgi:hypothetical protein
MIPFKHNTFRKKMCIAIVHTPKLEQLALITTHNIHSKPNKGINTAGIGQSIENFKAHNEISIDPPTLEAIKISTKQPFRIGTVC